jgi:putative ABC transport system permease protein
MHTIAIKMLLQRPARFAATSLGLSTLFFLCLSQVGMLVGWCNTVSAIIVHAGVDLWVIAPLTTAFDYGTPIPSQRLYQVRTVPGVSWAEAMYMDWSMWQRPDGKRISIEVVGLDDSSVGGPWVMVEGSPEVVHLPDAVIVDQAFLSQLGIQHCKDEVELFGRRAVVRGISRDVRTFTASPFVFTSLENARRFDQRYRDDEVTYVLARVRPGASVPEVQRKISAAVPDVEVLTTRQFALRTILYWMLETGVGVTVVITAALGFLVSAVVVSQTLYTVTQDNLHQYATLSALGFAHWKLASIVLLQSLVLGSLGWALGTLGYYHVADLSIGTPVPLEMTPEVFLGIAGFYLLCCILASFVSVKSIFQVDPGTVFRA